MDNLRLLCTGSCGFIGSNFVRYIRANYPHAQILIVDCLTYAGNLDNIKDIPNVVLQTTNICDEEQINQIFEEYQPNVVVHYAAESMVDRSIKNAQPFIMTNVYGTYVLLQAALQQHKKNRSIKFVQIGSDEVYGHLTPNDPPFNEDDPIAARSPYSASKASSDYLVLSYWSTYRLPVIVSRSCNVYGPYQHIEKLIPKTITNIINNQPIPIYGKGEQIREWLYVEDHCKAIEYVIKHGELGEVYNIGSGLEFSNINLVRLICASFHQMYGYTAAQTSGLITFVEDRLGHDFRYALDCTKLKKLGFEIPNPIHFTTKLEDTIRWYIEHPKHFNKEYAQ